MLSPPLAKPLAHVFERAPDMPPTTVPQKTIAEKH
jgi:hypothetical protein